MKWNKYRIKTKNMATDFIAEALYEMGITGVQIEDNIQITQEEKEMMHIDYLPVLDASDDNAYITFYTEDYSDEADGDINHLSKEAVELGKNRTNVDDEKILEEIREKIKTASEFIDVGEGTIEKSVTEDVDWVNNWKEHFKSFEVGSFTFKPTWEETDIDKSRVIEIDPGTAFGTGKHDTTQLCISALEKYVKPNDAVLDLGCGSGILSIVAKKLGCGKLTMTDIDPIAVQSAKENFEVNKILDDTMTFRVSNVLEDEESRQEFSNKKYDIVVANILADVIVPIASMVDEFLKPEGIFISSGIIYMKEEEVVAAVNANKNLELLEVVKQGDWRSVIAKKK